MALALEAAIPLAPPVAGRPLGRGARRRCARRAHRADRRHRAPRRRRRPRHDVVRHGPDGRRRLPARARRHPPAGRDHRHARDGRRRDRHGWIARRRRSRIGCAPSERGMADPHHGRSPGGGRGVSAGSARRGRRRAAEERHGSRWGSRSSRCRSRHTRECRSGIARRRRRPRWTALRPARWRPPSNTQGASGGAARSAGAPRSRPTGTPVPVPSRGAGRSRGHRRAEPLASPAQRRSRRAAPAQRVGRVSRLRRPRRSTPVRGRRPRRRHPRSPRRRATRAATRRSTSMRTGQSGTSGTVRASDEVASLITRSMRSPSRRRLLALILSATVAGGLRAPRARRAPRSRAPPDETADACFGAAESARSRSCARRSSARRGRCSSLRARRRAPRVARTDCREWLAEATDAQPSIVIAAPRDPGHGPDRSTRDVERRARGHRRRARRRPARRHPHRHRPRAPSPPDRARGRRPALVQDIDVREGEKGRVVDVYWHTAVTAVPAAARARRASSSRAPSASSRPAIGTYFEATGLSQRHDLDTSCKPTRRARSRRSTPRARRCASATSPSAEGSSSWQGRRSSTSRARRWTRLRPTDRWIDVGPGGLVAGARGEPVTGCSP